MDPQLIIVLSILAVTVVLIVTEFIRIDVVAIMAMLALAWSGAITPEQARSGFASNAVVAILAVMVMGRGLYKAGVTEKIASFILAVAGRSKRRIISTISLTVGAMSGFLQNIGAAALFLPVLMGISEREKIAISGLLMPMGFAALLGGTLTMVGTSSLIVLNDLLAAENIEPFDLFSATPVGIALLLVGVVYFFTLGDLVFPSKLEEITSTTPGKELLNVWGLSDSTYVYRIPPTSPMVDKTVEQTEMGARYKVNLLREYQAGETDGEVRKGERFQANERIVLQGRQRHVDRFADERQLELLEREAKSPQDAEHGYLEIVIPARSSLVGRSLREVALRETHQVQVVLFFSESEVIEENIGDRKLKAGDTLILHGRWENLQFFQDNDEYITVTPLDYDPKTPEKAWFSVACFAAAIGVVFLFDLPISVGFLTGAVAMILGDVLSIEEAYRAIEWKVIFLLAGLIPIGIAMNESGAASFLAQHLVGITQGQPPFLILLAVGVLTTLFSLLMSNVAATVLLVPLVLELSGIGGLSSQVLVLQVGLCSVNSFLIPTHHVNALLMTPGGYRVSDYLKAGGILSVLFVLVSTTMLYLFYQ